MPQDGTNQEQEQQKQKGNQEAKFTQADLDKYLQTRLNEQKIKFEQELADQKAEAEKQAELAKMDELKRAQTELEDYKTKYQKEADKNAFTLQKEELRKYMTEKEVPSEFLDFVIKEKDMDVSKSNVDCLKKVLDDAIKKGIEEKIPSHVPSGSNNDSKNQVTSNGYRAAIEEFYTKK